MSRSKMAIGIMAAFGLAVALAGVGDSSLAVACDKEKAVSTAGSGCCAKGASATAASVEAGKKQARYKTASMGACTRGTATAASAGSCTGHAASTTASAGACPHSATMAAGSGSGCESAKSAKTAAMHDGCEGAKSASLKTAVDKLPYAENKRVVLAGTYECGHCGLGVTEECTPLLKTADGKVYPLLDSARVEALRAAKCANGVEVSGLVRKVDGVKFIDVKSYRAM